MNWSLKTISTCIFIALFFLQASDAVAQSKTKFSFGAGISGGIGSAITGSKDYNNYLDTIKSASTYHLNKGVQLWLDYSLSRKADLQIGLGFQQIGFARKQTDLTFKNYTYPGIGTGRIEDLSNTPKGITYNYRFSYLQVPLIFNSYFARSGDFKWVYHFSAGLIPQVLLKHQLVANCIPGYSIEGKNQFKMDSSGFNARSISVSMQLGLNIEYRESKNKTYFIQPMFGIYPVSVSKSGNEAIPYYFCLQVGVLFAKLPELE